nr:Chain V, LPP [Escherichia coli K-12]7ARJ_V Chain V, LPP [Escherichia coli K-12]7ARL_V Chain V, LPP [Escherichia coli K-12]7ARM_V Chain V, LPP [Escherichia coli BL21(DE3)]
CSSNAKIDQL